MYISWKLCRMIRPGDFRLYSQLKFCLQRSIWSIQVQHDFINERKIDLLATAINTIHYCQSCRRELFMFIWVRRKSDNETKNDKKRRAYCQVPFFVKIFLQIPTFADLCFTIKSRRAQVVRLTTVEP